MLQTLEKPARVVPVAAPAGAEPAWLELVRRKVASLQFGQVYIVVHDHVVTQIECTEKTRLAVEG